MPKIIALAKNRNYQSQNVNVDVVKAAGGDDLSGLCKLL